MIFTEEKFYIESKTIIVTFLAILSLIGTTLYFYTEFPLFDILSFLFIPTLILGHIFLFYIKKLANKKIFDEMLIILSLITGYVLVLFHIYIFMLPYIGSAIMAYGSG